MLAQESPTSFVSGEPITIAQVLQGYNRNEFHHLYPRAYLRSQGYDMDQINRLANFVFMSSADNKILGGDAPSQYKQRLDSAALPMILERSVCPANLFDDDYSAFLKNRAARLSDLANRLIEQ
jgi:hypothetical protein